MLETICDLSPLGKAQALSTAPSMNGTNIRVKCYMLTQLHYSDDFKVALYDSNSSIRDFVCVAVKVSLSSVNLKLT